MDYSILVEILALFFLLLLAQGFLQKLVAFRFSKVKKQRMFHFARHIRHKGSKRLICRTQ